MQAGQAPGAGEVGRSGGLVQVHPAAAAARVDRRQLARPWKAPVVLQPVRIRLLRLMLLLQPAVPLVHLVMLVLLRVVVLWRRGAGMSRHAAASEWAHHPHLRGSVGASAGA